MVINYVVFCLFFILLMIVTNFIREKIRGSISRDIIRTVIFYLPFLFPALLYGLPHFNFRLENGLFPYTISIGCAFIALVIQYKDYSPLLSEDIYPLLPPIKIMNFIGLEVSLIGSAIFEEIFYRAYVPESIFWIECLISGGLFCLSHYLQPLTRKTFTIRSYAILFLLSVVWYYSYQISGTLLPAIIGHLIYNSASIYIVLKRYIFTRKVVLENQKRKENRSDIFI